MSLMEAVELVIQSACRMPMDSFRDAPERWRDSFGALQASLAVLASARDREKAALAAIKAIGADHAS